MIIRLFSTLILAASLTAAAFAIAADDNAARGDRATVTSGY